MDLGRDDGWVLLAQASRPWRTRPRGRAARMATRPGAGSTLPPTAAARVPVAAGTRPYYARTMFVIELVYKANLKDIDANMRAHMAFVKQQYAAGKFLVSGRKIPRDGGIILAIAESRGEIEEIVREDPFVKRGLAEFRVIEFRASQRADDIPKRVEGT